MKKILLSLAMLLWAGSSFAYETYPAIIKYAGKNNVQYSSLALACASWGEDSVSVWRMNTANTLCQNVRKSDGYVYASKTIVPIPTCNEGHILEGGGTTCAIPDEEPPPPPPPSCPQANTNAGRRTFTMGYSTGTAENSPSATAPYSPVGQTFCEAKCQITPGIAEGQSGEIDCYVDVNKSPNGYYRDTCVYPTIYTGNECTETVGTPSVANAGPSEPTVPSPGENKCPAGTISGGIDMSGIPICIGNPTPPSTPPPTTTKPPVTTNNPDGSTTTKQETTRTNSDGSTTTTTTTTTTAADGTKTVTVTSNTSAATGGGAGKADAVGDQQDLCTKNPNLTICQNSTVAGSCGSVTCNGDAIQCALLRTQSERNCRDKENEEAIAGSSLYAKGSAAAAGNDPDASNLPSKDKATSVAVPSFDNSGWLGGGACFPDKTFTVQGKSITLSFTAACQPLLVFRYVLMIISMLISFRMFSGTILKD